MNTLAPNAITGGQVKPDYKIPSIKQIRKIKPTHSVVSLFAGGGGSSFGYRMAGFKILFANEFIKAASDTYRANKSKSTIVNTVDVRELTAEAILDAAQIDVGELDILDGSPPCTSFSMAGSRQKGWGKERKYYGKKQTQDDLFIEYTRILKGLQPKVFIAENVTGLVMGSAKGYFLEILRDFKSLNYTVKVKELNAFRLGVPQKRKRIIFIGVRNDLMKEPIFPKPLPYQYNLRECLVDVDPTIEADAWCDFSTQKFARQLLTMSQGQKSKVFNQFRRAHFEQAVHTVTAHCAKHCSTTYHPTENRLFSIAELKRVCSFPDDYKLTGSYGEQGERLGLAVPPLMIYHVARMIKNNILTEAL